MAWLRDKQDRDLWGTVGLSVLFTAVGIAVATHAMRTGERLRREWFDQDPAERGGELGDAR